MKSWFFEKREREKKDKPLHGLTKKKREKTQIIKMRTERGKLQLILQKYK